jgi:hypothetical protein
VPPLFARLLACNIACLNRLVPLRPSAALVLDTHAGRHSTHSAWGWVPHQTPSNTVRSAQATSLARWRPFQETRPASTRSTNSS